MARFRLSGSPIGRQAAVLQEFEALSDYLWKLPRFIEAEEEIERQKLFDYFPSSDDPEVNERNKQLRLIRFAHEFGLLRQTFPQAMGASCLVHLISCFEFNLLQIARDHEARTGIDLKSAIGRQPSSRKLLTYIKTASRRNPPPTQQYVDEAIHFRNCLVHAGGLIAVSTNSDHLRRVLDKKLFWPQEWRFREDNPKYDEQPRLISSDLGDRLFIPMLYTFWLCHVIKEVLLQLCVEHAASTAD